LLPVIIARLAAAATRQALHATIASMERSGMPSKADIKMGE
jgi:hypothetical protein